MNPLATTGLPSTIAGLNDALYYLFEGCAAAKLRDEEVLDKKIL